ncbi:MAG TPA: hypothetical protein PK668_21200 [Myxococcota bacterium]|nr:hypothetical protein [Myxococcota bacterium]HRY95993.1 hypothetical protein [Myxococcota bacterium]HSA21789.1 hypothetical protein [Myxococcota bacterium]
MQAASRRALWQFGAVLAGLYLLFSAAVCLRSAWRPEPQRAAEAYLRALQARDATGVYMLSDLLGARLAGLTAGGGLEGDAAKHLQAKDFARWKAEFERGADSQESLRREVDLVRPGAELTPVEPEDYQAEVPDPEGTSLESYRDSAGELYHRYWRLAYPSAAGAPEVGKLENVQTGKGRRLKAVTLRLEVRRRPELGGVRAFVLALDALDPVAWLAPARHLFSPPEPSAVWMVRLCFAVDKTSLETF